MNTKAPKIPPANISPKGPGEGDTHRAARDQADKSVKSDQTGQQANTKINLTHQGQQQDR
jgi:hypothetical protein